MAVSRAIGDFDYKQFGVTAEPETFSYEDLDELEYILLACDGLYDVLSNEEIDHCVRRGLGYQCYGEPTDKMMILSEAMEKYVNCQV